jgi:5-methylcytosine-specific restriction endonuclease McrA
MCDNKCQLCERDLKQKGKINLQVHHILPVKDGGSNDPSNLLTLCAFCNQIADSIQRKKNKLVCLSSNHYPEYIEALFRAIDGLSRK